MLSEQQIETFRARGVLRLPGFLPQERAAPARVAVLRRFEEVRRERRGDGLPDEDDRQAAEPTAKELGAGLDRQRDVVALIGEEVRDAVRALLGGAAVGALLDRLQLLITLPNATEWTVPHALWHLDLPRLPLAEAPGVQIFTFLDTVAPGGGGTLVVAGSHRLLNDGRRLSSAEVKRALRRETYFRELMSQEAGDRRRFLTEPGRVGDVPLQVVELCGEPGDLYLTDLRLLHAAAPNASGRVRVMATQRFLREALSDALVTPAAPTLAKSAPSIDSAIEGAVG